MSEKTITHADGTPIPEHEQHHVRGIAALSLLTRGDPAKVDRVVAERDVADALDALAVLAFDEERLIEKLGEAEQREAASSKETQDRIERLQTALAASQKLETDLAAAKAVIATQEQILQRLPASAVGKGTGAKKRDNADAQEGLFEDRRE